MTLEKMIGNKIRSLRTLKELSQENVAEMLGISVTAYSKIERGETDVQLSRLNQIAQAFEVSIEEILNFGDKIAQSFNGNGTGNYSWSPAAVLNNNSLQNPTATIDTTKFIAS